VRENVKAYLKDRFSLIGLTFYFFIISAFLMFILSHNVQMNFSITCKLKIISHGRNLDFIFQNSKVEIKKLEVLVCIFTSSCNKNLLICEAFKF
jgi:hypothetical protein